MAGLPLARVWAWTVSLDHFVGAGEECLRHGEAERPGRLEVDDELELGGLLDRKVRWLHTLENSLNIGGSPTIGVEVIRAVRNQCTVPSRRGEPENRRQAVIHR